MSVTDPAGAPPQTIIALGGGGFSDSSEPALDVYVLECSDSSRPRVGFIATASGDGQLVTSGAIPAGIGIDDGAAAHFSNGQLHRVVIGRSRAGVHQVTAIAGEITVQPADAARLTLF